MIEVVHFYLIYPYHPQEEVPYQSKCNWNFRRYDRFCKVKYQNRKTSFENKMTMYIKFKPLTKMKENKAGMERKNQIVGPHIFLIYLLQ